MQQIQTAIIFHWENNLYLLVEETADWVSELTTVGKHVSFHNTTWWEVDEWPDYMNHGPTQVFHMEQPWCHAIQMFCMYSLVTIPRNTARAGPPYGAGAVYTSYPELESYEKLKGTLRFTSYCLRSCAVTMLGRLLQKYGLAAQTPLRSFTRLVAVMPL